MDNTALERRKTINHLLGQRDHTTKPVRVLNFARDLTGAPFEKEAQKLL